MILRLTNLRKSAPFKPFRFNLSKKIHYVNIRITQGVVGRIKFAYERDVDNGICIPKPFSLMLRFIIALTVENTRFTEEELKPLSNR